MHPAAKFQLERVVREFAERAPYRQTSDHLRQPGGGNPPSK
jgi:hypothetical protein